MERKTGSWHSPALKREMHVASWGHFGKPVLLFPTAGGDFLECERFLMIRVLEPLIDAGRIKVYACGSISGEGWLDKEAAPWHKSWLQARFDEYLVNELLPHIQRDSGGERGFVATGASLGAYNAMNAATKHPEWFDLAIGMSGTYDFDRWMGGHRDQNYYYNQPMYFLAGLDDARTLAQLRKVRFVVATGQGRAEAPDESVRLAKLLESKGAEVSLEIWAEDAHHDWPTWRTMLPMFLDKLVP
jgi:esterase/lipase superfamily enzyme